MASNPPPDLALQALNGPPRTVQQLLTTFHLFFVALDPYTKQSEWLLPTAARILSTFDQADCRVAFVVTGDESKTRRFLGRYTEEILTFVDPQREAVRAFGLQHLPAVVHLAMDGTIFDSAEGWNPLEWRRVVSGLSKILRWKAPVIPGARDPGPFEGTPAMGRAARRV